MSKKLTPEILGQITEADFQVIEMFCTRSHFEYTIKQEIHAVASALDAHRLQLVLPMQLESPRAYVRV